MMSPVLILTHDILCFQPVKAEIETDQDDDDDAWR